MNIPSTEPHDRLGESDDRSKTRLWLGIALLALVAALDLFVVDRLASYASTSCGAWQSATNRALLAELVSSTVFVCLATAFVLSLVRPHTSSSPAWVTAGVIFVVIETSFKVVLALYESFYIC